MMLRPSRLLVISLLAWLLLGLAASWWKPATLWWTGAGLIIGLSAFFDAVISFFVKNPTVERKLPSRMAVGVSGEVKLRVTNRSKRHLHLAIFDGIPERSTCEVFPWRGWLKKGEHLDLSYPVVLHERGGWEFQECHLLITSLLGLWARSHRTGERQTVRVYPNYQPVLSFALLAMAHRQDQTGIVRKNRAGLSRDFHQLRDYQRGDSMAQIDWKASSKRQTLISRDFQEQLDQVVILMLDCGRRMRTLDGEMSQFDHCLNAMLLLSYVALRQGDQVGILSFGGTNRWLAPVKGSQGMPTILNHLYDYETSPFPSDFSEAAERLLKHQKRRAMVVILTNLRGEDAHELTEPLRKLRQKHIVVLASLREAGIDEILTRDLSSTNDALAYLAAEDYAQERKLVLATLQQEKIVTLDETAGQFPVALANSYLDTRQSI